MLSAKEYFYFYRILKRGPKMSSMRPLGYLFLGYALAGEMQFIPLLFNTIAVISILLFSFSLNDFLDGKVQKEKNFITWAIKKNKISEKFALLLCILPTLLLPGLFFVKSTSALIIFFIGFILATTYSPMPFRLKQQPRIGLFVSPVAMVLLFLEGFFVLGTPNWQILIFTAILLLFQFQVELLHLIEDSFIKEEIRKIKVKTALIWLKRLPLISAILSVCISIFQPIFLVNSFFSIIRFNAYKNFKIKNTREARSNVFSLNLSLYEFALYAILAFLGLFR